MYQKENPVGQKMKVWTKNQKFSFDGGFWFLLVRSLTSPDFKTQKTSVQQRLLLPIYISIPKLCTIFLTKDLNN